MFCVLQNRREQQTRDWVILVMILHVSRRLKEYIINGQPLELHYLQRSQPSGGITVWHTCLISVKKKKKAALLPSLWGHGCEARSNFLCDQ